MREQTRARGDVVSLGPECAVLCSIGTVYLYRLRNGDLRSWREQPGTRLAIDKFRRLLARIGSTAISDKGVLDAGSLAPEQVESLSDDEVERLAEAYLESTTVRRYQQEAASATPALVRGAGEPASKFLDRLVNWYASTRQLEASGSYPALALKTAAPSRAAAALQGVGARELWITLAGLAVVAALAVGAIVQNYLAASSMRREQAALLAQVRQANALLTDNAARASEENAQLARRIEALEQALKAQAQPAPRVREAKAAARTRASGGPASGARPRAREPAARR